jgi:XTP/dITP diphosphohydrolase
MKELLVATGNRGKFLEIEELLRDMVGNIYSLEDFPDIPKVEEDGVSFEENAVKKGQSATLTTGKPTIADDSGLVVNALGGLPGVHSARFAGDDARDSENNAKLLLEMAHLPEELRTAAFHCVIALCFPDGYCRTFTGALEGVILNSPRGTEGFGYDPLFFVPGFGLTLAELPLEVKNTISHRGKALARLKAHLAAL